MKRRNAAESAPTEKTKRTRLPLSAYLSYLLVATVLLTGVTFSGYITAVHGDDAARVAKFAFTDEMFIDEVTPDPISQPIEADLYPGESVKRTIEVENNSEVAVNYEVALERVTNNLPPLVLDLELKSGADVTPLGGNAYQLPAGKSADFLLTITWPGEHNSPEYAGLADELRVVLTAEQAD